MKKSHTPLTAAKNKKFACMFLVTRLDNGAVTMHINSRQLEKWVGPVSEGGMGLQNLLRQQACRQAEIDQLKRQIEEQKHQGGPPSKKPRRKVNNASKYTSCGCHFFLAPLGCADGRPPDVWVQVHVWVVARRRPPRTTCRNPISIRSTLRTSST